MVTFFKNLFGGGQEKGYEVAEIYATMRQRTFELPKEEGTLGSFKRIAILMETRMADACYSLVAVADLRRHISANPLIDSKL